MTYLITNTVSEQQWALIITLSVLLGSVTLVVQFLVDFDQRLGEVGERFRQEQVALIASVTERFAQISEATRLYANLERSSLPSEVVTPLLRNVARVSAAPALALALAEAEVRRTSEFLHQLQSGSVAYPGEDQLWLIELAGLARTSMDATSLATVDGGFWTSDAGQRYLLQQQQAVRDGVRIRRLFIGHSGDKDEDAVLTRICAQQVARGILVKMLDPAEVPPLMNHQLVDFIVFDGVLSYETTPASALVAGAKPTIDNTRLIFAADHVRRRMNAFEEMWEAARGNGAGPVAAPVGD